MARRLRLHLAAAAVAGSLAVPASTPEHSASFLAGAVAIRAAIPPFKAGGGVGVPTLSGFPPWLPPAILWEERTRDDREPGRASCSREGGWEGGSWGRGPSGGGEVGGESG